MGKIRTWQHFNPLFLGKYKRLLEDQSSEYSKLIIDEPLQDHVSYSCGHCGHIQKLQAEEINNIVGHAFRLAYTAHLRKSGTSILDVPVSPSSRKKSKSQKSSRKNVRSPRPKSPSSDSRKPSALCRRFDSKKSHCFSTTDFSNFEAETTFIKREKHLNPASDEWDKLNKDATESSHIISSREDMRTPAHKKTISTNPFKPNFLTGLELTEKSSSFLSPDSNSPTELNTLLLIEEKPQICKDLTITAERCASECGIFIPSNQNVTSPRYLNKLNQNILLKRNISGTADIFSSSGNVSLGVESMSSTAPPIPERYDSLTSSEEPDLRSAAWFQAGIPREIALEVLSKEPVGAFMVRESTSKPGCYALSLRVPRDFTVTGIAHYLIVHSSKGYKIKGFTKDFPNLTALITHHSVMPELLPCPLSLHLYNPFDAEEKKESPDDDPDYSTLSAFRKMMADLNV